MTKLDGNNENIFYAFILNIAMKYVMEIIQSTKKANVQHAKNVNVTSTIYAIHESHDLNNKGSWHAQMVFTHASRTLQIVLHDSK